MNKKRDGKKTYGAKKFVVDCKRNSTIDEVNANNNNNVDVEATTTVATVLVENLYDSLMVPFDVKDYKKKLRKECQKFTSSYECISHYTSGIVSGLNKLKSTGKSMKNSNIDQSIIECRKKINTVVKITKCKIVVMFESDYCEEMPGQMYSYLLTMTIGIINIYSSLYTIVMATCKKLDCTPNNITGKVTSKTTGKVGTTTQEHISCFMEKKKVNFKCDIKKDNIEFLMIKSSFILSFLLGDRDTDTGTDTGIGSGKITVENFTSFLFLYVKLVISTYGYYKIDIFPSWLKI